MNINTNTIPKTLQAYLYRNSNYEYLVMPHKEFRGKVTEDLKSVITEVITRVATKSKEKSDLIREALDNFQPNIEEKSEIARDFESAKKLLGIMLPILKINTGNNLKTPSSYLKVVARAESHGLYAYYFEQDLHFNKQTNDLSAEAHDCYKYDDKFSKLYSNYRKLGYSDQEARFECEPELSKWIKLSPRRNTAAAVTVAPFLLVSIPVGLWRTYRANSRNNKLQHESADASASYVALKK
ncbi:MAG: hypothetical protein ABI597_07720 [Gammaproteobacteria bacterium]